jgi:hypothetical protein
VGGGGPLRTAAVRQQLFFPDKRLIQYDCGKLQARREGVRTVGIGAASGIWAGECAAVAVVRAPEGRAEG